KLYQCQFFELTPLCPLGLAIFMDDKASINILLDAGADINYKARENQYTPIEVATQYQPQHIPFLINKGGLIHLKNNKDKSPIFIPCMNEASIKSEFPFLKSENARNVLAIQHLIKAGASPTAQDSLGFTPLHIACFHNKHTVMELLLDKG